MRQKTKVFKEATLLPTEKGIVLWQATPAVAFVPNG